jgi:predicted RNA-binding Zn ribbon-like protein
VSVDGARRAPAPEPLRLVQEFVNTIDIEEGRDELAQPGALRAWLADRGLMDRGDVSEDERRRAVEVREAIRVLLLANGGAPLEPEALAPLNAAGAEARLGFRVRDDGRAELEPESSGIAGALGRLLAIVYTSMADGTWRRLKACANETCRWAFWDSSRNQTGKWCSMAVCGSRAKSRAYRARSSARTAPPRSA